MKPTNEREEEIDREVLNLSVDANIRKRWENGADHHPESEELARDIAAIDWLYCGDSFGFKFGGDGDNGESLIFILDVVLELRDKRAAKARLEAEESVNKTTNHASMIGWQCILKTPMLGNPAGTFGYVFNQYADFDSPDAGYGVQIIFPNGEFDGFSLKEQAAYLEFTHPFLEYAGYKFTHVIQVSADFKNGYWDFSKE